MAGAPSPMLGAVDALCRAGARAALAGPTEALLTAGGDSRLAVDPATGLNAFGCSPRPRPWAITFASTTATSISDYAYAAAERCRRRLLAAAQAGAPDWDREIAAIKAAIRDHYGLAAGTEVVLTPSGTDGELGALAVHRLGRTAAPSVNLVIAPEETGTGVRMAAAGRHFADVTALGVAVERGAVIAGLGEAVSLASVAIRAPDGAVRDPDAVDADVARAAHAATASGRRVLLHILDVSKTGLLAPSAAAVARLVACHGSALDVLVDACQARLSAASVRAYLAAGFMVLVTGSKFFTGPPFAGALLVPPALAARLDRARLPAGLAAYACRLEWPDGAAAALPVAVNRGLAMRWVAALAEMQAFAAAPSALCRRVLDTFGDSIAAAIAANRDLEPLAVQPLVRPDRDAWDALPTIFSFAVRGRDGACLDVAALRVIHRDLNRDLSAAIVEPERALAARCCHIGQPVAVATDGGRTVGDLRLAAGARLVSGVHTDPMLGPDTETRLRREIADARRVLDKLSLIVRHRDA